MLILTIYAMVAISLSPTGSTTDYKQSTDIQINGTSPATANVTVPSSGSHRISIATPALILGIVAAALVVGIAGGIRILGSGISDQAEMMLFNIVLFMGFWACLTIVSSQFLFSNIILTLFYLIITIIYVIGFGLHVNRNVVA